MTAWYYSDAQRNRLGPVAAGDLAQLHDNGQLAPEVLVWREGMPDWRPWREVMEEVVGHRTTAPAAAFAVAPADAPAGAGGDPYEVPERASPYAAPAASVEATAGYRAGGEVVEAGFWKRVAALFIDSFLVTIAFYAVVVVLTLAGVAGLSSLTGEDGAGLLALVGVIYLAYPVVSATYYVGMETSGTQATLGKMAVGIKVTDAEGRPLTRGRALGRWLAHLLCYLTFSIGYVMAAFTRRKQGLHDLVAGTLVVDRWAYTAHPERQRRELGTVAIVILAIGALLVAGYVVLLGAAIALAGLGR